MSNRVQCKDEEDGTIHYGRWLSISRASGGLADQHTGKPHEWEMVDHNSRECSCGASQFINWDERRTLKRRAGKPS